ncbi:MAG TPA: sigma 54-interacting transcriptional regulator, partial [Polyangia bacterium]
MAERDSSGETLTSISSTLDGRLYLLVLEAESSSVFPLPRDGKVVIGRAPDVDLKLRDQVSSRRHAELRLSDGRATLSDLDSHNGTRVNGERLDGPRPLLSGDTITVGGSTLVLHCAARPAIARRLLDPEVFQHRLAEELERASAYGRPLTLIAVALGKGARKPAQLEETLAPALRLMDAASLTERAQLVVLCPELDRDQGARTAERVRQALSGKSAHVRLGVACHPEDGCDAETLLTAAVAAADAAAEGQALSAAESVERVTVGERTALLADPAMIRLFEMIRRLAATALPVLVTGETGAGKELAASAIHFFSSRASRRFVTLNCAALQDTLAESELFGYEKGAFSGAAAQKQGLLEVADGGTVFLDEVGELSLTVQAKLLRALEERSITRVGGVKPIDLDFRIVAATNRNLEDEVKKGRFRQDLFFRLSAATVVLPPLRDRPRELGLLARAFLAETGKPGKTLSPASLRALAAYSWPGNVRELRNTMEYLAATIIDEVIEPWHLPERITGATPDADAPAPPAAGDGGGVANVPHFAMLADEVRQLEC